MRIFGLGPMELGIILVIVLLLFGPKQIPKLSRMFGKAVKDVKDGLEGNDEEPEAKTEAIPEAPKAAAAADEAKKPEDAAV
jgi:sec-independent protein translocase protein TatA